MDSGATSLALLMKLHLFSKFVRKRLAKYKTETAYSTTTPLQIAPAISSGHEARQLCGPSTGKSHRVRLGQSKYFGRTLDPFSEYCNVFHVIMSKFLTMKNKIRLGIQLRAY